MGTAAGMVFLGTYREKHEKNVLVIHRRKQAKVWPEYCQKTLREQVGGGKTLAICIQCMESALEIEAQRQ